MTPIDVVTEARRWIGTPWHHQARRRGVGVDCVGLVIGVARALGLSDYDVTGYGELPNPEMMRRELQANLIEINVADSRAADVLWMRIAVDPQHLAIVTGGDPLAIIHSIRRPGRVVEHELDDRWRKRVVGAFRFRAFA